MAYMNMVALKVLRAWAALLFWLASFKAWLMGPFWRWAEPHYAGCIERVTRYDLSSDRPSKQVLYQLTTADQLLAWLGLLPGGGVRVRSFEEPELGCLHDIACHGERWVRHLTRRRFEAAAPAARSLHLPVLCAVLEGKDVTAWINARAVSRVADSQRLTVEAMATVCVLDGLLPAGTDVTRARLHSMLNDPLLTPFDVSGRACVPGV